MIYIKLILMHLPIQRLRKAVGASLSGSHGEFLEGGGGNIVQAACPLLKL
jgi:hypothetical protein